MAAVSGPYSLNGFSVAIFSIVVFGRIPSSRAQSPTASTWVSNRPSSQARWALRWLRRARPFMSSPVMPQRSAIRLPPRNWWIRSSPKRSAQPGASNG